MGRRSHSRTLGLWANGERVGRWTVPARGEMELQYDETWVRSSLGRPLSLSLPFNPHNEPIRGDGVAHYFDNLLPDSDAIRRRVAARIKTDSHPFDGETGRIIFRHLAILQTRDLFQIIVDFAVLLFSDPGTTRQNAVV